MRKFALFVLLFVLNLNTEVTPAPGPQSVRPQTAGAAEVNKTVVSNGTILLNGRPFPMVLDAGTDCFTPQDYDLVMSSKDESDTQLSGNCRTRFGAGRRDAGEAFDERKVGPERLRGRWSVGKRVIRSPYPTLSDRF